MSKEEPTPLGVAVLSLLEERDMHPYEMMTTLRERKEDQWVKLRTGSLYHQVEKLAEAGLTEACGTEQHGNRPPRTTYRLTSAGAAVLKRWVSVNLTLVENPYLAFSLALGEIATLPPDQASNLLTARRIKLDEEITELLNTIDIAMSQGAERIWMLAHEHKLALMTTERDYLATLVKSIESEELTWPKSL